MGVTESRGYVGIGGNVGSVGGFVGFVNFAEGGLVGDGRGCEDGGGGGANKFGVG
jgi:hypothetical protein